MAKKATFAAMPDLFRARVARSIYAVATIAAANGKRIGSRTLAERCGVPRRAFEPDLQALVAAGILIGRKGPSGGYTMAESADRITLGDVARVALATGGTLELDPVLSEGEIGAAIGAAIVCAETQALAYLDTFLVANIGRLGARRTGRREREVVAAADL